MEPDITQVTTGRPGKFNEYLIGKGKEDLFLVSFSLITGIIFDYLFYGVAIGISYPIFVAVFYGLFFCISRKYIKSKFDLRMLLLLPILLLSLTFLIFSNTFLATINFLIIPILIIAQTVLITENNRANCYKFQFINDLAFNAIYQTVRNIFKPINIAILTLKIYFPELSSEKYSIFKKIFTGLIISLPILIIVVNLLASADSIFNASIESVGIFIENININRFIPHLILVTVISFLISGYLWSLFNSNKRSDLQVSEANSRSYFRLDPVITSTVLVLVNLVYILFSVIQFSYLFGDNLASGYTYSEYARKGFFELVVVTIINLSILVGCINFVKKENKLTTNILRVLLSILVLSTSVILYSAHFRMALYEEAYGYTYLRLYVHVFMFMLFTWFLLAFYRIWKKGFPLAKLFLISSLSIYTILNYLNVDNIIAENNVDRYVKLGIIDVLYLEDLSYDALPHLLRLEKISDNMNINISIKNYLTRERTELLKDTPWQSYNLSRERAKNILIKKFKN